MARSSSCRRTPPRSCETLARFSKLLAKPPTTTSSRAPALACETRAWVSKLLAHHRSISRHPCSMNFRDCFSGRCGPIATVTTKTCSRHPATLLTDSHLMRPVLSSSNTLNAELIASATVRVSNLWHTALDWTKRLFPLVPQCVFRVRTSTSVIREFKAGVGSSTLLEEEDSWAVFSCFPNVWMTVALLLFV